MAKKTITYSDVINTIEEMKLKTRWDVVSHYIGYCGTISKELYEHINKAYYDMFIKG